jgi:hypothetical protein
MPAKSKKTAKTTTAKKKTGTFSADERAAMKERAREVKGGGGEADLRAKIAAMAPADRTLAKQIHALVTAAAPGLTPKTWYGMPAYANADGKIVVFFQPAGKFKAATRRSASTTRRSSTTARCGRRRSRSRSSVRRTRRSSPRW